jgi:hypothetical protein
MPDTQVTFKVIFDEPKQGPAPLFCNHVGIARAGTEVQFEFVALDIGTLANALQQHRQSSTKESPVEVSGKTVAKIVMPLHVFLQLKGTLNGMFSQIEQELNMAEEGKNEPSTVPNV